MARILIIDDDDAIRASMKKILEREGHEVVEAGNGDAGLAAFRAHLPDLVVTDLIMPDKEGIETILDLREVSAEVPILAVSGGDRAGPSRSLVDAEALGANASLPKPFSVDQLRAAVAALLS